MYAAVRSPIDSKPEGKTQVLYFKLRPEDDKLVVVVRVLIVAPERSNGCVGFWGVPWTENVVAEFFQGSGDRECLPSQEVQIRYTRDVKTEEGASSLRRRKNSE